MQQPFIGKYFLLGLAAVLAIVLADQYTKWLAVDALSSTGAGGFVDWLFTAREISSFLSEGETFKTVALAPFLNFVMVWNQGISFGLLDGGSSAMPLVLIGVSILASLLMTGWLAVTAEKAVAVSLTLIVGGALANVIDRIRFGAVADFIDVHLGEYHWPAFNLADSCIVLGAGIMVVCTFIQERGTNE